MRKLILLISSRPDDQAFVTAVAAVAEAELKVEPDPVKALKYLADSVNEAIILMADVSSEAQYKKLENVVQDTIGLLSDRINANHIHFISSEPLEKVQYLVQSPLFGHFILRHYGDPKVTGTHYGRLVKGTLTNRAFGLDKLLKAGAKTQIVKLQLTTQKQDAVEAIKNYLLAVKFQSRMATTIANSVDEILMNAMFDAPTDDVGRPIYNLTARSTVMKLEGRAAVEMHVGFDGEYVAIMAVDLFGSLDKMKLLTHISKIYTEEEYRVKTTVAGAGIGLATVFRSGGSFFFVSESGTRTEVTVFFKRTDNFREFRDQFRFLSTQFYF